MAVLELIDGTKFEGTSFGAEKSVSGEVVFNTGMVGYVEALTDPSYKGQILVLTYPLIGNYGVGGDWESDKIQVEALVISDYSLKYSHHEAIKSLSEWLKENNLPGIFGVDTRRLTKRLREGGAMLGRLIFNEEIDFSDPNKRNLVGEVSLREARGFGTGQEILLVDCGCKLSILRNLLKRNVSVLQVPWNFKLTNEIFERTKGVILSNGPGDPMICTETIELVKELLKKEISILGICLGNQILALATGARTYKLKYGHRGQNQPCRASGTERCFITSQNHGYAVDKESLPSGWEESFYNLNDGSNEGITNGQNAFGVQFHPEAMPGPNDLEFLFDEFIKLVSTTN